MDYKELSLKELQGIGFEFDVTMYGYDVYLEGEKLFSKIEPIPRKQKFSSKTKVEFIKRNYNNCLARVRNYVFENPELFGMQA